MNRILMGLLTLTITVCLTLGEKVKDSQNSLPDSLVRSAKEAKDFLNVGQKQVFKKRAARDSWLLSLNGKRNRQRRGLEWFEDDEQEESRFGYSEENEDARWGGRWRQQSDEQEENRFRYRDENEDRWSGRQRGRWGQQDGRWAQRDRNWGNRGWGREE